jgi:hypothetical protein
MRASLVIILGLISAASAENAKPKTPVFAADQITAKVIKLEKGERVIQVKAQANAEPLKVIAKSYPTQKEKKWTKMTVAPWETVIFEFRGQPDYSVEGWEKNKKVDEETATKKTGMDHI